MSTSHSSTTPTPVHLRGKEHVTAWSMTPDEAIAFIRSLHKTVITFFGYSGLKYENEDAMLQTAREVLLRHPSDNNLVNIGGTGVGIGAIYPLAKSMGFITTGIVSVKALQYPDDVSEAVDYVCFIEDSQWGGKLPNSDLLSPTSRTMVECSDILVGIGGGDISLDEMLAGHAQGKEIYYFPADMNHAVAQRQAAKKGLPPPTTFKGSAHDTMTGIKKSDIQKRLKEWENK